MSFGSEPLAAPVLTKGRRLELVESIHADPTRLVLVVAGGGNAVITDLLDVPGASRTVLEIVVPYATSAMRDFLGGHPPGGTVSAETAEALAEAALARACNLRSASTGDGDADYPLLGVACTAALTSDRPKKGDHRAHIALCSPGGTTSRRIDLAKGAQDRTGEDRTVADAILLELAEAERSSR